MNSGHTENNLHGNEVERKHEAQEEQVGMDVVCSALNRCKPFLWGNAAYAVAFCVCRDLFGWQDNAACLRDRCNRWDLTFRLEL